MDPGRLKGGRKTSASEKEMIVSPTLEHHQHFTLSRERVQMPSIKRRCNVIDARYIKYPSKLPTIIIPIED